MRVGATPLFSTNSLGLSPSRAPKYKNRININKFESNDNFQVSFQ